MTTNRVFQQSYSVLLLLILGAFAVLCPGALGDAEYKTLCPKIFGGLNVTMDVGIMTDAKGNFQFRVVHPEAPGSNALNHLAKLGRGPLGLKKLQQVVEKSKEAEGLTPWGKLVNAMDVTIEVDGAGVQAIPVKGPVVIVMNHPLFGVEAFGLIEKIAARRPDIKFIGNKNFLEVGAPEYVIPAQPVPDQFQQQKINLAAVESADEWVGDGHVLLVLPSGDMSYRPKGETEVTDPPWKWTATRMAAKHSAPVVPVFSHGKGSELWLWLRQRSQALAHILDLREIGNQKGTTVRLTIGNPVHLEPIHAEQGPAASQATEALRQAVYDLKNNPPPSLSGE